MAYQVLPFKEFVTGTIGFNAAALPVTEAYIMIGGLGAVFLGAVILEKLGITINETMLKATAFIMFLGAVAWFIAKNPLIRHLMIGF
ncbi:hypothetical protein [Bacillus infantis]|uniref:hypothetical protein n=1 Tax=Bacillus infantis TaxID=324767 RepID=UPI003CFADD0D